MIKKHISGFTNKYGITISHFNPDIQTGIDQYNRRIERMNNILNDGMNNKIFIFFNEDGLYDSNILGDFASVTSKLKIFRDFIKK
jgi:hypothetical protein